MRTRHSSFRTLVLLATSCLAGQNAYAAPAPAINVPTAAQPEFIQRQYQVDERPELSKEPVISVEDNHGKPLKGNISFELKSVDFDGNTKFSADDLKPLYADKLGTKISLTELNEIANKITGYYRNHGYILSRAVVPPQRIGDGHVKIRIVEGFVSNVVIQGDGANDKIIQGYADKIRASNPLNASDLERYLLLMQDLPGVTARAVLKPSAGTPGASDVVIDVTRKPVEASASLDNRGSRYLGPVQLSAMARVNNLFGWDDQTQVRAVNTPGYFQELVYGEVRHEEQLGTEGTKFILDANQARTQPGYTLDVLDLQGISTTYSAGLSHPLIRSRQDNWFLNGDFTAQHVTVNVPAGNIYRDDLRVLTMGSSYDFLDSLAAVNRVEVDFSKGFNWGTGNDGLAHSRADGQTDFFKMYAKASRIQPIVGPWGISAAVEGQWSADPLLAAEEMALGGADFGSAYDPAEITGDSGIAGRLELQYSETPGIKYLSTYQLYGFYDAGVVWNRGQIVVGSEAERASLASAGLGARMNFLDSLSGGLELAVPLTRKVAASGLDGSAPRAFFNLEYRY